jgi:hypothetical protein
MSACHSLFGTGFISFFLLLDGGVEIGSAGASEATAGLAGPNNPKGWAREVQNKSKLWGSCAFVILLSGEMDKLPFLLRPYIELMENK